MRKIVMPCPACANEHNFNSELWIHAKCRGVLYIDDTAIVHCQKCGKKAHISKMYMSCNKHKNLRPAKKQIMSAITMGRMCRFENSLKWLLKVLYNI